MRRETVCAECDQPLLVGAPDAVQVLGVAERLGVALVANDLEAVELTFHHRCYARWDRSSISHAWSRTCQAMRRAV